LLVVSGGPARAQGRFEPPPTRLDAAGDPATPDFDLAALRRGQAFRLFANSDLAVTGIRGAGDLGSYVTNVGPCEPQFAFGGACHFVRPARLSTGAVPFSYTFQVFELQLIAGVSSTDWQRSAQRAPSLQSVLGGGYSVEQNFGLFGGRIEIGPADGSLGTLFSGATTTADGSCLDNTGGANGFVDAGNASLAAADCPATWAGGGFAAEYRIPEAAWVETYRAQGSAFRFDRHRVGDELRSRSRPLGDFATYGRASDHYREILAAFGAVLPGGFGPPRYQGWPLGLAFEFRAYTFLPSRVASVLLWDMLVINRSQDVYGVGLDYDSVYLGIQHGPAAATGGGGDRQSLYWDAQRSTMIWHQSGVNPSRCQEPGRVPAGGRSCAAASSPGRGYGNGGNAIVWLKSPYGDQRNKLFTRPSSPFYDPAHPAAGDTILLNHGHMCGFGTCWVNTHNRSDKRAFGLLSSTEANVLDGRNPTNLTRDDAWTTFRNREYPAVRGVFNKWVPGGFDYNKDGIQDTLYFDTCGGRLPSDMALGCVTLDADTMPGGQINAYGNVGGITAAGPFRLAAGDTAVFTWAFVGSRDSASTMATIDAMIEFYQRFYEAPEPPGPTAVLATQVVAGGSNSSVTLLLDESGPNRPDSSLLRLADDIDSAASGTELARLRALNPTLPATVRGRAAGNLQRLEVYKSCDDGVTFTADSDCRGDALVDAGGYPAGTGWRPYSVLATSGAGAFQFVDRSVLGGRRYTYVVVGRSRGVTLTVQDSVDANGDGSLDAVGPRELVLAPPLANSLTVSPDAPNVAVVYVPASRQAGGSEAGMRFVSAPEPDLAPLLDVQLMDQPVAGRYRVVFGDRVTVSETRSAPTVVESTVVVVEDVVFADSAGVGVTHAFDAVVGVSYARDGVPVTGASVTVGTTTRVISPLSFVLFRDATPLLLGASSTPPSAYANSAFPGVVMSWQGALANRFAGQATLSARGDTLRPADSTTIVSWRPELSTRRAFRVGGLYRVEWSGDPFGGIRDLEVNTLPASDPASTEQRLRAALESRSAADTGATDSVAMALAAAPVVAARLPFRITNAVTGQAVTVAVLARPDSTVLLGSPSNTLRVTLPATEWVPGDRLVLMEDVEEDSTVSFRVILNPNDRDANGKARPFRVLRRRATLSAAVLGCTPPSTFCNPLAPGTPGATGYTPIEPGTVTEFMYYRGAARSTLFEFDVTAPVSGADVTSVSRAQLDSIRVVPNPFVIASAYQVSATEPRLLFTHLPPRGTLRIYTVSGQFVQQIIWTEADLSGSGDLFWNLTSRGGRLVATGLYIWVLTTDVGGSRGTARGKFVIIR
jgi:hypothetical protein